MPILALIRMLIPPPQVTARILVASRKNIG
jgi:hypothetical protein